ncbi:hypothetical protein [Parasitella parasitica]|uniref:Uncharacterized protein n=1 Tax=Parasitella parasitica TaxID=35722 RepID=A0A0B7MZ80_9FUNG|nr:hypothetical protein [Parasitella parasitica]
MKNIRDNAAILIESKKLAKTDVVVNGIDYIGDTGYLYEFVGFEDVIVVLPTSKLNTSHNLATLHSFGSTLNSLYYLERSDKDGKCKELLKYDLIDVFDTIDGGKDDLVENEETNIFYATRPKKSKSNEPADEDD